MLNLLSQCGNNSTQNNVGSQILPNNANKNHTDDKRSQDHSAGAQKRRPDLFSQKPADTPYLEPSKLFKRILHLSY